MIPTDLFSWYCLWSNYGKEFIALRIHMSKGPASFCPSGLMFPWKNQDSAWPPLSLQGDSEWCFQIALWDSGDTFKASVGQPELKCRNLFLMKIHMPNFLEICCFKGSEGSSLIVSLQSWIAEITFLPLTTAFFFHLKFLQNKMLNQNQVFQQNIKFL